MHYELNFSDNWFYWCLLLKYKPSKPIALLELWGQHLFHNIYVWSVLFNKLGFYSPELDSAVANALSGTHLCYITHDKVHGNHHVCYLWEDPLYKMFIYTIDLWDRTTGENGTDFAIEFITWIFIQQTFIKHLLCTRHLLI